MTGAEFKRVILTTLSLVFPAFVLGLVVGALFGATPGVVAYFLAVMFGLTYVLRKLW